MSDCAQPRRRCIGRLVQISDVEKIARGSALPVDRDSRGWGHVLTVYQGFALAAATIVGRGRRPGCDEELRQAA